MPHKREERREGNELEPHYNADTIVFPSHREKKIEEEGKEENLGRIRYR